MKESREPVGTVSHTARLDPGGGCLEIDTSRHGSVASVLPYSGEEASG
jgi:hypothetical protein